MRKKFTKAVRKFSLIWKIAILWHGFFYNPNIQHQSSLHNCVILSGEEMRGLRAHYPLDR